MKRDYFFSVILWLILIFGVMGCVSTPSSNTQRRHSANGTPVSPNFLELNLGDSIDYSLFNRQEEAGSINYKLKVPRMVFIFGKQPSEVIVYLDESEKIKFIQYTYGTNGDYFSRDDGDKALLLFDQKADEQNLTLAFDSGGLVPVTVADNPSSSFMASFKVYSNENDDSGMSFNLMSSSNGKNINCIISIMKNLSENMSM